MFPDIQNVDLGHYARKDVSNLDNDKGRAYFDMGLRHMLCYQHEMASRCFLACLQMSEYCALAHGFLALCHSPNYNFKGEAYYESAHHPEEVELHDLMCVFPSQQVADRHSRLALEKIEALKRLNKKPGKGKKNGKGSKNKGKAKARSGVSEEESTNGEAMSNGVKVPSLISDVETHLLLAIRILTCHPGLEHTLSHDIVGTPYKNAMRAVYQKYPNDPEVAYCFAEALMVLNAWQLYEYPTGKAVSPDVEETRTVLETALKVHTSHAGLCHMYVHLSEMSAHPEKALVACEPLRQNFPQAGHLIHMPTHIDVLVGDYEKCVLYNCKAIEADEKSMKASPGTAGRESFYFGYIVHNFHMAVYGAILGGFEAKAMELAKKLNDILSEEAFEEMPDLTAYLEAYSALDIHIMVRFGRWKEILELELPRNKRLMLFRAASTKFAQALAHAALGDISEAKREANNFDSLRGDPESEHRILHNNSVENLLAVDAMMLRGEIAYREGKHSEAFDLLRKAVKMQDNLLYGEFYPDVFWVCSERVSAFLLMLFETDEPWGKMQPIRHALGGLLLEQGYFDDAEEAFRKDLDFHPRNPWALVGLISVLKKKGGTCCSNSTAEIEMLEAHLREQRAIPMADFEVTVACACCQDTST